MKIRRSIATRMVKTLVAVGCIAAAGGANARESVLFHDSFTGGVSAAWTLQPPMNALGPIATNGAWQTETGSLVATGIAAPWTVRTAGDAAWNNYRLAVDVTIRKPGPTPDYPIFDGEYDRWLPRAWYPPLAEHPGQFRYRYYAGEFDWGSDAAVWVRYQDRENGYRVQLSTVYQELILWHGIGGYLAVVPCKIEPGKTYRLEVLAQGAHIQVRLDGKKKIDYWHGCLPTLSGKIGLGAYQATAAFSNLSVTALPAAGSMPAHKARFSSRTWRTQRWVFDGDEPITLWQKAVASDPPGYCSGMFYYLFVKLRPGYRPLYYAWVGVRPDQPTGAGNALVGTVNDIKTSGENTERFVSRFVTATPTDSIVVTNTATLTYDEARGTYRHDMLAECLFLKKVTVPLLELCDPLTYNNKEPGQGNRYRWLPAGHQWGIFLNDDDTIRRHPIAQSLNIGSQNGWISSRSNSFWVLMPDRAVCPAFEHMTPGQKMSYGVCHWGYDWHQCLCWQDKPRVFTTGETFTVHYALTGYPPAEAEKLLKASSLHPKMEDPPPASKLYGSINQVPDMLAYPVVEPAGTTFEKLYSVRVPYVGWQWYGDYANDRDVGRTDRYSMRLDGPASINGQFYHHMIDSNAKRYLCTFWLKTRGVKGVAPVAIMQYPWNDATPKDRFDTGLVGDHDWTELSFVTTQPVITTNNSDSTEFVLECRGTGQVWLDDWSVRPLADDEQPAEKRGATVAAAPGPVSPDFLMDVAAREGAGPSLQDASGHNNNVKLHDVTWTNKAGGPFLHFDGSNACAFAPLPSPELQPADKHAYKQAGVTLETWVCPSAGQKGGPILGSGNSPMLQLVPSGNKFTVYLNCASVSNQSVQVASQPGIATSQWTHVAGVVAPDGLARLYINGKPVAEKPLAGKIRLDSWRYALTVGSPGFAGDLAGIRWWSRAATDAEIAASAAMAPDKP